MHLNFQPLDYKGITKRTAPRSRFVEIRRLADGRSVAEFLLGSHDTHLAVRLLCHQYHALGLYAADLAGSQVGQDAYLLADHLLRGVVLGDARDYHTLVDACVDGELQQLVGLGHSLGLQDGGGADVHLAELVECTFLLLGLDRSSGGRGGGIGLADILQTLHLGVDGLFSKSSSALPR